MTTRQIKFRAWDRDRKEWFNATSVYIEANHGDVIHIHNLGTEFEEKMANCDHVQLSQFTGLKDKNGKEIYEGDIVRGVVAFPQLLTSDTDENCNFKMGGEVFWDESSFELRAIRRMCDPKRDGMVNYFSFISDDGAVFEDMEVVGNIYENPELLK